MHAPLLLALALAQPAPLDAPRFPPTKIAAEVLPPAAFTQGPVRADALRLAHLIMPTDLYLATLERGMMAGLDLLDGEFAEFEPKVAEALKTDLTAIIRDHERAGMPRVHDRIARAIGSYFSAAEIIDLTAFYQSRTGQKIIVGKFAGVDISGLAEKFIADPDAELTVGDISQINRDAVGKIVGHLDEKDSAALLRFMATPVFARLRAFTPIMMALEAQMASEPDPDLDAKIEAAALDILARFGVQPETS